MEARARGGGTSGHLPVSNQDQMPPASISNCSQIKTNHLQIRKTKKIVISFINLRLWGHSRACQQGQRMQVCAGRGPAHVCFFCVCVYVSTTPNVWCLGILQHLLLNLPECKTQPQKIKQPQQTDSGRAGPRVTRSQCSGERLGPLYAY